jgi:hypothetical protein
MNATVTLSVVLEGNAATISAVIADLLAAYFGEIAQ